MLVVEVVGLDGPEQELGSEVGRRVVVRLGVAVLVISATIGPV